MNGSLRYALLAGLPVLAILIVIAVLNPKGNYWGPVEPPKAQVEAYDPVKLHELKAVTPEVYDQHRLNRLIREPQNTISNLAYAIAGLAISLGGRHPASRGLGLAGLFLGIGSGLYHLSLLPEWRMIDILGVYAVLYGLVFVGISANYGGPKHGLVRWTLVIAVWLAAVYTGVNRNDIRWLAVKWFDSTYVFVAAAVAISLLVFAARKKASDPKRYRRAVVVLGGAALISFAGGLGDRFGGFWASPDAVVQGHAVWHTFGAVALLATYEAFATTGFDHSTLGRRQVKVI